TPVDSCSSAGVASACSSGTVAPDDGVPVPSVGDEESPLPDDPLGLLGWPVKGMAASARTPAVGAVACVLAWAGRPASPPTVSASALPRPWRPGWSCAAARTGERWLFSCAAARSWSLPFFCGRKCSVIPIEHPQPVAELWQS